MSTHCPACGKPWPSHPSIAATCVKRQTAERQLSEIEAKYHAVLAKNEELRAENFRLRESTRTDERLGNGG